MNMQSAADVRPERQRDMSTPARHHRMQDWRPAAQSQNVLGRVVGFLRRRKLLIVSVTVLSFVCLVAFAAAVPARYTAVAEIVIDPRVPRVLEPESVLPPMPAESEAVKTAIELLGSQDLIRRAIDRIGLRDDPDLNQSSRWQQVVDLARQYLPEAVHTRLAPLILRRVDADPDVLIARRFQSNLRIVQKGRSSVVAVSFTAGSAERAVAIVNAYADLFVTAQAEEKAHMAGRAYDFLSKRVGDAFRRVIAADTRVEEYRRENNLIEGRENTPAVQEVTEIASQLTAARSDRDRSYAELHRGEALLVAGQIEALGEMQRSPVIQQLRSQEAALLRQVAELQQVYGDRHPQVVRTRAELASLREKIATEGVQLVNSLRSDARVADALVTSLTQAAEGARNQVAQENDAYVELRALERDADAARTILQSLLTRLNEVTEQTNLQPSSDFRVSSHAPPGAPASPSLTLLVAGAVGISVFLGIAVAFFAEQFRRGVRSMQEIEPEFGLPALALVPYGRKAADMPLTQPCSAFVEGLRHLYVALTAGREPESTRQVILVTSSVAQEGKTTIALGLARLLSKSRRSVVLLDADLRRSGLRTVFGDDRPGLGEILQGQKTVEDVVIRDPTSGLAFIPAGRTSEDPAFLLGSPEMPLLIQQRLCAEFATVIIDSSPVIPVSDTLLIAGLADQTVMVSRWEKTPPSTTRLALRQLMDAGAHVAGVAISHVSLKRLATYSYGDSCLYDRKNRQCQCRVNPPPQMWRLKFPQGDAAFRVWGAYAPQARKGRRLPMIPSGLEGRQRWSTWETSS